MIRFVYANDLHTVPHLADTMFRDRAGQFHDRLNWDLNVDANGHERDAYDALNPLYCIYELPDGSHGGSGRLMPTLGRTMFNEHFTHLSDGVEITSPLIWESTRFCISPRLKGAAAVASKISTALMLAGCEVGLKYGLSNYIAVFERPMLRIYRSTGWGPEVIGEEGEGRNRLCLGLWEINAEVRARIQARAAEGLGLDTVPRPLRLAA
ncbi:MAG: N-acyl-L-homoserine lactone synthetase [Paracoccaceae bacterium]|jgi:N-acyl-L-homoserine lactone synthetase